MPTGYHFTGDTLRDGRPVPAIGETLVHDGPWEWCESGLYASRTAWQALRYAPGPRLHRVMCEDVLHEDDDKFVCRRRTIIASIDAEHLLHRFKADQALSVVHLWTMPDAMREYLTTLDESKRAAAWSTVRGAAWDAVKMPAWNTARDAARAAVKDMAPIGREYTVWDGVWNTACSASRAVAWAAVEGLAQVEARNAVWSEAWNAVRTEFQSRVDAAFSG